MKAITLIQPWATLVAIGEKKIETRSWTTDYRGPLAIHAAKGMPAAARDAASSEPIYSVLRKAQYTTRIELKTHKLFYEEQRWLPSGMIVATCELVKCIPIDSIPGTWTYREWGSIRIPPDEPELSFGDYRPGRYAWIFRDVQMLEIPISAKGALGLWNLDWDKGYGHG